MSEPVDRVKDIVRGIKSRLGTIANDVDILADIAEHLGASGPDRTERPKWLDDPATDLQLSALRKWGLEPHPGMTKGEASSILAKLASKG